MKILILSSVVFLTSTLIHAQSTSSVSMKITQDLLKKKPAFSMTDFPKLDPQSKKLLKQSADDKVKRQQEIHKIMKTCEAVTTPDDVNHKRLAHNISSALDENCVVSRDQSKGVDEPKELIKKMKKAMDFLNQEELWTDVNKLSLKKDIKGLWATQMSLILPTVLDEKAALDLVCKKIPTLCPQKELLKDTFKAFQAEAKLKPIKFFTGAEQSKLLSQEFNPLIERINEACQETKKAYQVIKNNYSCAGLKTPEQCQPYLDQAYKEHKELEQLSKTIIDETMSAIVQTKIGHFLISETFSQKVGNNLRPDYIYDSCMKGSGKILNPVTNQDVLDARTDLMNLIVKDAGLLKSSQDHDDSYDKRQETLDQHLLANPLTVAELLHEKADPQYAWAVCSMIKDIQASAQTAKTVHQAMVGAGFVASVALAISGLGAPAGAALGSTIMGLETATFVSGATFLGTSGYTVMHSASQIHGLGQENQAIRGSVLSGQKNFSDGIETIKQNELAKDDEWDNIKLTVAADALGFTLGSTISFFAETANHPNLLAKIMKNSTLSPESRFKEALKVIQRSRVTPAQKLELKKALEASHAIGEGQGVFTYTWPQLRQKYKILLDGGYTPLEANKLIRLGLAGKPNIAKLILSPGEAVNQQDAHGAITSDLYNGEIVSIRRFSENDNRNEIYLVTLKGSDPYTGEVRYREALFKPRFYGDQDGWARNTMEYVAYDLGRTLGMDYIPPTAYRRGLSVKYDGKQFSEGAFVYKAPDYTPLSKLPNGNFTSSHSEIISDHRILSVLMHNPDGHYKNLGMGKHWVDGVDRPVFLDWNACLRPGTDVSLTHYPVTGNSDPVYKIRQATYDSLKKLNAGNLQHLQTSNFISADEIQAILGRRDTIIRYFDDLAQKATQEGRDLSEVFFKD